MVRHVARIVAVILLAVAGAQIAEGDCAAGCLLPDSCAIAADGDAGESDCLCFSCAAYEGVACRPRFVEPSGVTSRPVTADDRPQPGIRPAPYHPPR